MKRLTFVLATVATSHALRAQAPTQASAPPRNAASVEHLLRPQVLIAGQGDTAFDIVDRMRYWHVPGISLAIVDGFRIVYAKGFGVTEFGGTTAVDTSTLFWPARSASRCSRAVCCASSNRGSCRWTKT